MASKKFKYSMGFMNYCSHDPGCALVRTNGVDFEYVFSEEGFLSRKKKSYQFPLRSLKYCLDYFDIEISDVDVFSLDFMDHRRTLRTSNNYRLLVGDYLRSRLKINQEKIFYSQSHHYAHALTAFWPSGFNDAVALIVDGLGSSQQTHSIFYMTRSGDSQLLYEQNGVGIGALYSLVTAALGFDEGEEGKTMGLAPYGRDYTDADQYLPDLRGEFDGFSIDYSNLMVRAPSTSLKFNIEKPRNKQDLYSPVFTRLAYKVQKETERCLSHLVLEAIRATGCRNIVFAGGVALNCVANNKMRHLSEVDNFFVQPASGDTGIPLGLAMSGLEKINVSLSDLFEVQANQEKVIAPYSCDEFPIENLYEDHLVEMLKKNNVKLREYDNKEIARRIADKKIVGLWTQGIELGPRALGHRSFLADARTSEMKDILNTKIKHRESYRPFAPVVLKEDFGRYFVSEEKNHPYMLQAPRCNDYALKKVPAICHVDNTSRVQTVTEKTGNLFGIINAYRDLTGESVIVNTSFNDNNEPIVFTKLDALCTFLRCNADTLVLEDKLIDRKDIESIEQLRIEAEALQTNLLNSYYKKAIAEITEINVNSSVNDFYNFIEMNGVLTKHFRVHRMTQKLFDYLVQKNPVRILYLDEYHFNLINKFLEVMGLKFDRIIPRYTLIQDCKKSIRLLSDESDFICYNLSGFFHNNFVFSETNKKGIFCFYNLDDRIIDNSIFKNITDLRTSNRAVEDVIMSSYEHDRSEGIDTFFMKFDVERF